MDDYHQPQHVKLVEEMLAELDGKELAAKSNALTGGSMRGEDALKVALSGLCQTRRVFRSLYSQTTVPDLPKRSS